MDWGYVKDQGNIFVAFNSGDLQQWCESLGIKKTESPVYHPRANGLAERAVQTVKRALQAWSPNLVSTGAFMQRALMTHRNTSKTRSKTPVELLLGRRVRLPAIVDFDLCEPILFKANEKKTGQFLLPSSSRRAWTHFSYSPKTRHGLF